MEKTLDGKGHGKPRVAWFSSLLSSANRFSLSDYWTRTLVPHLRENYEIVLFTDRDGSIDDLPTFPYQVAALQHQRSPFDCCVYQLDDTRDTYFSRIHMGLIPGIVIFHDFILSTDGPEQILNSPWESSAALFEEYRSNQFSLRFSLRWPRHDNKYPPQRPYALREAGYALIPIFSSAQHQREFLRRSRVRLVDPSRDGALGKASFYLPHPVQDCGAAPLRPDTILFCGTPALEHRSHHVLEAIAALKTACRFYWMVGDEDEARAALRLCAEFGVEPTEIRTGRSLALWSKWVSQGGIAIHTGFGGRDALDPFCAQSLMAGILVIVGATAENDLVPSEAAFRVEPGPREAAHYTEILNRLLSMQLEASQDTCVNHAARDYALEIHAEKIIASEFSMILVRHIPSLREFGKAWRSFEKRAQEQLIEENLRDDVETLPGPFRKKSLLSPTFLELGWLTDRAQA